ncbi:MAG: ribulose-phosphate 3-epimerase [Candidatus Babeliales bacterium]
MALIFPSLISANLLNLQNEIDLLDPYCEGFHLDVMDNHFVPSLTWGAYFINQIAAASQGRTWVHLMVDDPDNWIPRFTIPSKSIVSFHFEASPNPLVTIQFILKKGWVPSLAINPKTKSSDVFYLFDCGIKHVLIMAVEPGFSGQLYLPGVNEKIEEVQAYKVERQLDLTIALDGGINKNNIAQLARMGVEHFAVATGIFSYQNRIKALQELNRLANPRSTSRSRR